MERYLTPTFFKFFFGFTALILLSYGAAVYAEHRQQQSLNPNRQPAAVIEILPE
jgi:hypothetical protein